MAPNLCLAQNYGSGPTTHSPTLSFTYNGGSACYPYQVQTSSASGSIYSCIGGILTLPLGGNGGGGTGSSLWETNSIGIDTFNPVGIGSTIPNQALSVGGNVYANSYITGNPIASLTASNSVLLGLSTGTVLGIFSNGNVGIGSLVPGQILDVTGTTRTTNLNVSSVSGSTQCLHADSSGNVTGTGSDCGSGGGGSNYWSLTAASGNVGISTTNTVGIGTSSGSAALTIMNGNVGIGTYNPNSALQITGNTAVTGSITARNTAWSTASWTQNSNAITTSSSGNVVLGNVIAAGSNSFTDNVGIGSTVPGQALDVKGTARVTGFNLSTTPTNGYVLTTDASGNGAWVIASSGSSTTGTNLLFGNGSGGFTNVSNTATAGGNVGIGSLTPGQILDVQGTVRTTGFTLSTAPTNAYVLTSDSNGLGSWKPAAGAASTNWTNVNTTDVDLPGGNVGIGTTFTTTSALTVMNGNVGIGTWVPVGALNIIGGNVSIGTTASTALLTVGNNANLFQINSSGAITQMGGITGTFSFTQYSQNSSTNGTIQNTNATAGSSESIVGGGSTTSHIDFSSTSHAVTNTTDFQRFLLNNTTEVMRLQDNSGNWGVGIGSTSPGGTFDVEGTLRAIVLNGQQNTLANVGIGTFGPGFSLDIAGTLNGTFGIRIINASNGTGAASGIEMPGKSDIFKLSSGFTPSLTLNPNDFGIFNSGSGNEDFLDTATGSNITFLTGLTTSNAMEFNSNGNLGIGSTAPGQRLDVKGTMRFTGSLVNTTSSTGIGWSEHNATNQACNTTCGTSACVIGLDIGTVGVVNSGFVACTDATADDCICAGP